MPTLIDIEDDGEHSMGTALGKDSMFVNCQTSNDDDLYGVIVNSEEEAYNLYCEYGARMGFSVRIMQRRKTNNVVKQVNYCCSKEGFKLDSDPSEVKKADRLDIRTGCTAKIRFGLQDNNLWKATLFVPEHNHKLAELEERQFLRSNRKVSNAHQGVIRSMKTAGMSTINTYSYLAEEVGGSQNVGFTKTDCYNFVSRDRMIMLEAGDAQSLINLFKRKQIEDPMFFYTVQVDQENRMTNFFWRDGKSKIDFECFGDVVVFDTTYRTNKYNMICAPFVGVNHHWKNVLFGCAFLLDETTASFIWLFETFLEAMEGKKPKTIFTDRCQAMANAIEKVFPETRHRLCLWHISKNAVQNLNWLYRNSDFGELFKKLLFRRVTEDEFESTWDEIIQKFDLAGNTWLQTLYNLREKWCALFSKDTFSAGILSTQRSESTNNVFTLMSTKTLSLTEFVHHYDKQAEQMRSSELEETFRCNNGIPTRAAKSSGIKKQAGMVYTRKIYNLFEFEFIASLAVKMEEVGSDGTLQTFELNEEGHKRVYIVQFNSSNLTISCSCQMYESMGWLCRHALRVLNVKNITQIPTQYILKRWTKDAKKGVEANSVPVQVNGDIAKEYFNAKGL
ncbi:protein FAR1-RELATED SEQUENCE 5-like [Rosa chinensis]|uniref:protein FAR1-RELATED SEQUENCE 5-like n=1 Tax=Rosa chinensis TaxID=74649 RepID=UPI000D088F97|nr:protein FAR1-RELATED SEQUENCE 5-like [Rosa chinensis]